MVNTKSNCLCSLLPKLEKLYTISKNKTRSWCGSYHELLIAKFWLKLKKVGKTTRPFSSVQFSSVTQSCPTLHNPMDCIMPGLPVHHQLPEFTQTHLHWVTGAIPPSHPLLSPSPLALNLSQNQGLFRYDLNQTPYGYKVEVTNRFKGLDMIECLKKYGQRFVMLYSRQQSRPSSRKRSAKRQNGCLRKPYKYLRKEKMQKAKEKRKDITIWMQSS